MAKNYDLGKGRQSKMEDKLLNKVDKKSWGTEGENPYGFSGKMTVAQRMEAVRAKKGWG